MTGEPVSGATTVPARWLARCLAPVDGAWLAAFRVLFGLTLCVSLVRFLAYGWVDRFFVQPTFHFKYWGFSFVEPLPGPYMYGLFYFLTACALAVTIGFCFRLCAWSLAVGFAYLQLVDVTTYLNHYYLAVLLAFLLAVSPAHRLWSVDALLRPSLRAVEVARGWQILFRFQLGVVYTFAGLAKAQPDWLIHAQPLRIWLASRTDVPWLGPWLERPLTAPVMSWAGFLFDTSIAWLLLSRRTRRFAFVGVVVFHFLTGFLFPIGMFPVIMVLGALVFFEPDWPRRLWAVLRGRRRPEAALAARALPTRWSGLPGSVRAGLALALLHCLLQVVLPLRHLAYGTGVIWHEQGMRWSWRVMVREKNGSVVFLVRDKSSGRQLHVSPQRYLTRLQEREMSGQPDLILQLAHHIEKDFRARGSGDIEVRVESRVSLNGRRGIPLILPDVDLSKVEDGLGRARWIAASPPGAPPHLRAVVGRAAATASRSPLGT